MSFKKILLGIGIVFVVLIGLTFRSYKKEVARVQANPKQAYTEDLMKDGNLTELHKASYKGDLNKVSQLIQQGYDIRSKTAVFKFTPFHMSIFKGHTEVANFLLSKVAKIDEGSNFNQTPLHWAAFMGELESVKFLIKKGANLEKLSEHGWTALHYASTMGNLDIVQLLIQNGVQKNRKTSQGQTAKDLAHSNKKEDVARYLSSVN
ncbi:MAG: ankyrin repeat domain-containing protein [Oligoflexia bacterium]|nr:ankyrin repeat domain-containing protein [Oligoflexia bacterium]